MIRNWVKRVFGFSETGHVDGLEAKIRKLEKKVSDVEGQANVDAAENLYLTTKLHKIRIIMGNDDKCFSRFSRDQIEEMSIEEFNSVEPEIDKDYADGKIFLQ